MQQGRIQGRGGGGGGGGGGYKGQSSPPPPPPFEKIILCLWEMLVNIGLVCLESLVCLPLGRHTRLRSSELITCLTDLFAGRQAGRKKLTSKLLSILCYFLSVFSHHWQGSSIY